jgi:hypothetical protein
MSCWVVTRLDVEASSAAPVEYSSNAIAAKFTESRKPHDEPPVVGTRTAQHERAELKPPSSESLSQNDYSSPNARTCVTLRSKPCVMTRQSFLARESSASSRFVGQTGNSHLAILYRAFQKNKQFELPIP